MARNLEAAWTVNRVNALIRNPINDRIAYGTNRLPHANAPSSWFGGTTAGLGALAVDSNVQGTAGAAKLNNMIRNYTRLFNRICRKRMIIYYNNNGSLQVWSDVTGIGNFATGVAASAIASPATEFRAGSDIQEAALTSHLNSMYNSWWNNAGNTTVQTLTYTVCHTSCHSNCNCNRGRR